MDTENALVAAAGVIRGYDGRTDHVQLEAEEFDAGWLVYLHFRQTMFSFGGVNLVVDREDGSVRTVGSSIHPSLVIADYYRFRATTPAEQAVPAFQAL